jgi:CRP/FNR family transcriptional regulator, polysaccharide utilization system transcription regulator
MQPNPQPSCASCGSRTQSIIDALATTELSAVNDAKRCVMFSKGDVLYSEGQYASSLHCIHSGHVKVSRLGPDGKELVLRFAGPGDVLGYAALISGQAYTTHAVAVEAARVCAIPREHVSRIVRDNPTFALRLMEMISHELEDAERSIIRLAQKSVKERVAEALLVLRETFGTKTDGETINVTFTRDDLSTIVGTAPESVIRALGDFKREQLIATDGQNIAIRNHGGLAKAAKLGDY